MLTDAEREALTNYLEAAHDSGFALDDADLPRLLFRDGIAPLLATREAEARRDERRKVLAAIATYLPERGPSTAKGIHRWLAHHAACEDAAFRRRYPHPDPADARDDKEGR